MSEVEYHEIILSFDLLDIVAFQKYIKSSSPRIDAIVNGVGYDTSSRVLTLACEESLTEEDLTEVNTRISTYSNTSVPKQTKVLNTGLQTTSINDTTFRTVFQYQYQKESDWTSVGWYITSFGVGMSNVTYTMRVVNVDTNEILGEEICTHTSSEVCCLSVVDTIENLATLELQVKSGTGCTAIVNSAYILLEYN